MISPMFLDIIDLSLKTSAKMNSTVFIIMYLLSAFSSITINHLSIFLSAFLAHDFSP